MRRPGGVGTPVESHEHDAHHVHLGRGIGHWGIPDSQLTVSEARMFSSSLLWKYQRSKVA